MNSLSCSNDFKQIIVHPTKSQEICVVRNLFMKRFVNKFTNKNEVQSSYYNDAYYNDDDDGNDEPGELLGSRNGFDTVY